MVLAVWPIAIYWKAKETIEARNIKEADPPKEFAVTSGSSPEALVGGRDRKGREIVSDPLGAAPRLPFGHLNSAWETSSNRFRTRINCGRFRPWTSDWGRNEVRDGYVVLRGDAPPHFLTHWVILGTAQ